MSDKPTGSGWFSAFFGLLFLIAFALSFVYDVKKISPDVALKAWLVFAGITLTIWGAKRIKDGRKSGMIGQSTINFVVAIIGIALAILAIVLQK